MAQSLSKPLNPPTWSDEPSSSSLLGRVQSLCWFQTQVQVLPGRVIINTGKNHEDSKSCGCLWHNPSLCLVFWDGHSPVCPGLGGSNLKLEKINLTGGGRLLEWGGNRRASYKRGWEELVPSSNTKREREKEMSGISMNQGRNALIKRQLLSWVD